MNALRMLRGLSLPVILLALLALPLIAGAAVIINDTFQDANSQNQDLANNSLRLFNGRAGTVRTDTAGAVTFDVTNAGGSEGFWSYFTDGAPVTLDVGDKLSVSSTFTLQGFQANGQDLRFGLFDSKGTRNTANTTGGLNSPVFTDDTGYATSFFPSGTGNPFVPYRRTTVPGETGILNSFANFSALPGSGATTRQTLTNGTPYTFTFTVERLSATDTRLTVSVTGGTLSNLNYTAIESAAVPNTTFDMFAFRIGGSNFATQLTFSQLMVNYTPAAPSITTQPQPAILNVQVGSTVPLSVGASGRELTYQWRRNGVPITDNPTATTPTLQLTNVQISDSGVYDVVVSNSGGSVISSPVNLNVTTGPIEAAPVITDQPDDATVTVGSPVTLSVTAMGNGLSYQWFRNGTPISGATGATYTIPSAQLNDTATYTVVVSNAGGNVTSSPARVTVVSAIAATGFETPNNTTGVCIDTPLRITFNQTPQAGTTGSVNIYRADGTLFDSVDLSVDTNANVAGQQQQRQIGGASVAFNYYPVTINGNTASIYLHQKLEYNQTYYVTIDPGVITDASDAPFAGISDPNVWRFTTKVAAPAAGTKRLTVASNSSGDFCTVQGAVDFVPNSSSGGRVTINVMKGTYDEIVYVRSSKPPITVHGENRNQTVIQYANNNNLNGVVSGLWRALFGVDAADFILDNITLRNTTPKGGSQAEAFRGNNQRILLNHVNLMSFQDTLLLQGKGFVNDSYIEGDVDFTWGAGTVYFRNCELRAVSAGSYYSQIRNTTNFGNVYVNCRLTRAPGVPDNSAYLSRIDPDDFPNSQVIFIDALMDNHIKPEGWLFNNPNNAPVPANYPNIRFWEYNSRDINTGLPVDVSQRHPLSRQLTAEEAAFYRNPANVLGGWVPAQVHAPFDFDGDGKTDVSVFRPSSAYWYVSQSSDNGFVAQQLGASGDIIVPGDYDNDTRTNFAVFRPSTGTWYTSPDPATNFGAVQFGINGDIPTPGDYDGDGRTDLGVYRPSVSTFYVMNSSDSSVRAQQWGQAGDVPLMGDYDGDGKTDFTVFRPSAGSFYILRSSDGTFSGRQFGTSGDQPIAGDFDGDGLTDIAVYRPSNSNWYIQRSSDNGFTAIPFGTNGDVPSAGDYDGDGKWDVAVFRPSTGTFYILQSASSSVRSQQFGTSGDLPVPAAYIRQPV